MTRPVPNEAVDLVTRWEGCRLTAYRDVVGVLTIGYGSTGPRVHPGMTITQAQAREFLRQDLATAAQRLENKIGAAIVNELTDNQYAALLSFVFNVGTGSSNPEWTIWRRLRARQFDQIPIELMKFVNAGGHKVQGLVNRRTSEVRLWSTDEPGSTTNELPSSVTRETTTPPTPADPTPMHRSGQIITLITGALASIPVAVNQLMTALQPYAQYNAIIAQVIGVFAVVAAAAVGLGLVLTWLKKRENRS